MTDPTRLVILAVLLAGALASAWAQQRMDTASLLTAPPPSHPCDATEHHWINVGVPVRLGGEGPKHVHVWEWRCES